MIFDFRCCIKDKTYSQKASTFKTHLQLARSTGGKVLSNGPTPLTGFYGNRSPKVTRSSIGFLKTYTC